jgi:hypothetical protein
LTQTQKAAYYYQLLQLREIGIAIPDDEIVDAAPLQGKTRLREKMAQVAEQQAQAQQVEMEIMNRQAKLEESQIDNNLALAQERRARVIADIGLAKERESEVTQNNAKALLDNVRAYAEIENMDRTHLLDVMKLTHDMKIAEQQQADQQIQTDIQKTEQLKAQ